LRTNLREMEDGVEVTWQGMGPNPGRALCFSCEREKGNYFLKSGRIRVLGLV